VMAAATDVERRAALRANYQALLADTRANNQARLAAMKQRLLLLTVQLRQLWQCVRSAGRPAPTEVYLTAARRSAAVEKQWEKAEMLLRLIEFYLVPTEGSLMEAEVHLRLAREHLEAAEAQLTLARTP
jgi:hypothetical protein